MKYSGLFLGEVVRVLENGNIDFATKTFALRSAVGACLAWGSVEVQNGLGMGASYGVTVVRAARQGKAFKWLGGAKCS